MFFGVVSETEAVPKIKGLYFVNDQLTDTPTTRNNFTATGVNFNVEDHLFAKNRMNVSLYFPWTKQSQAERETKSFSPRGVVDLIGKDYTMNVSHGIIRNFDALVGERSSRDTAVGLHAMPDKFLPLHFNYRESKALVGSRTSTNKNWSLNSEWDWEPLHFNGGLIQQENDSSAEGVLSENEGAFGGVDATFNLWQGTFFHSAFDFSQNKNQTQGNETRSDAHSVSLLFNSDIYSWLNLSGSYLVDNTTGTNDTGLRSLTLESQQEISDLILQITPASGWTLGLHRGKNRIDDDGEIRVTDLTGASLSVFKEITDQIDGACSLTHSINDDSEQGKSVSTSFFITSNMILNPFVTLRLNTGVTKNDLPNGLGEGVAGPGSYSNNTNLDIWSSITTKTTLTLNYSAGSSQDQLVFFGKEDQNLGGTLSYVPKSNVIYNLSAFRHFPESGDTTSSYIGSFSYSFIKGSRMSLSYQRSDGEGQTSDSLSGNFIIVLPKQISLLVHYNLSGLSSDEKTTSLGIQFSKPF